jgi:hypothetical protein
MTETTTSKVQAAPVGTFAWVLVILDDDGKLVSLHQTHTSAMEHLANYCRGNWEMYSDPDEPTAMPDDVNDMLNVYFDELRMDDDYYLEMLSVQL